MTALTPLTVALPNESLAHLVPQKLKAMIIASSKNPNTFNWEPPYTELYQTLFGESPQELQRRLDARFDEVIKEAEKYWAENNIPLNQRYWNHKLDSKMNRLNKHFNERISIMNATIKEINQPL